MHWIIEDSGGDLEADAVFLRLLAFFLSSHSKSTNTAYTNMYIQKTSFPATKTERGASTYGESPAPFVGFNSEAISVMWFLKSSVLMVIPERSPASATRTQNSERPRRQHAYVRCRNCDCSGCSLGFWLHRDRLSRMVLQLPKTTRYLPRIRQELDPSPSRGSTSPTPPSVHHSLTATWQPPRATAADPDPASPPDPPPAPRPSHPYTSPASPSTPHLSAYPRSPRCREYPSDTKP